MANVTVVGYLRTNTGDQIPLRADTQAEGTEFTLQTDSNLTTVAQNVGNYKPGATIIAAEIFAPNGISYAYLLRQGVIKCWFSCNVSGVSNKEQMSSRPVTLRPGDTVRCLPLAAASKNTALCVSTSSGVDRIFVGTDTGEGTTQLLDLQDQTSIGDTLQGSVISTALATSVIGSRLVSSGSCWIRNASGQLAAAVPVSNPIKVEALISMVNVPIALNFTASIVTTA